LPTLCNPITPFTANRPHRLHPEIFRILFALAWHTKWSLLLYYIIGDWTIPIAANVTATLQQRLLMVLNGLDNPRNCLFPLGDLHHHLIHGSVGHSSLHTKRHVNRFRFSRLWTAHHRVSHYFTMGRYVSPNIAPSLGRSGPPSNKRYLGPIRVINPNGIWIGLAILYGSQMLCSTMHCQWGIKPPNCQFSLVLHHPTRGGPSHDDRQHAQKLVKIVCEWFRRYARRQTDTHRHIDMLITILCHHSRRRSNKHKQTHSYYLDYYYYY